MIPETGDGPTGFVGPSPSGGGNRNDEPEPVYAPTTSDIMAAIAALADRMARLEERLLKEPDRIRDVRGEAG